MKHPSLILADAIVDHLNARTWSPTFTAARLYRPSWSLQQLSTLRVTVIPAPFGEERIDRASHEFELEANVGFQRRVDPEDGGEIDGLLELVEAVNSELRENPLDDLPGAERLGAENDPVFLPAHLHQKRTFTSVLSLRYQLVADEGED